MQQSQKLGVSEECHWEIAMEGVAEYVFIDKGKRDITHTHSQKKKPDSSYNMEFVLFKTSIFLF